MPKAAVLGTGLIGASIGLALRDEGWETSGWDPDGPALTLAAERGAVDPEPTAPAAAQEADVVFLAGPMPANLEALASLETAALVTDVTSVKRPFVTAPRAAQRFVPGHPMAGREHAGPGAASPALFRGAAWILCDDHAAEKDIEYLRTVVESIGANAHVMGAAAHDQTVAEISHLPHLLAAALTSMVADRGIPADLVAGSFRDLTRVAAADTGWWPEVLSSNADEVLAAVSSLHSGLSHLTEIIARSDHAAIEEALEQSRQQRSAMAPSMMQVRVVLQDRPGEIASVGHALELSKVDVRDLQLRHAEHGGGGVLTITVRPEEARPLEAALELEGFETE